MKCLSALFSVAVIWLTAFAEENSFEGSKVYNVFSKTEEQARMVNSLENVIEGINIWQYGFGAEREARILVTKYAQNIFFHEIEQIGAEFEVSVHNLEEFVEKERKENEKAKMNSNKMSRVDFTAYYRYDEIIAELEDLQQIFPEIVTVKTIGKSYEGRDIKAVVISTTGGNDTSKPVIIADAAIHAREWICPSTALYMVNKLVLNVTEGDLMNKVDWVIIPVMNPDGYEYTHSSTANRFWRKTRSISPNSTCRGVDANRNFDFQWMVSGSSSNPCIDTYAGPKAFSEPEAVALKEVFEEYKGRSKAYVAIHSYGSYVLYPYGYNGSPTADDVETAVLGKQVGLAIDAASLPGSKKYIAGNFGTALYKASGVSSDFSYAVGDVKISYTLELPSGGTNGFDMPPSRIAQVVQETWEGFVVLARHVITKTL